STVLVPPAGWLRRHGFPPLLATWIVFLGSFVIIAALVLALYSLTQGQLNQLGHELSNGVNRAEPYLTNGPFHFSQNQVNDFINAVLLAFALLGLGVPLVLPLALLTFLGGYLPIVGAIVSGAFAALVALVIKGPIAALIIVGVTIVIHNVEGYIVGPKVLGHE